MAVDLSRNGADDNVAESAADANGEASADSPPLAAAGGRPRRRATAESMAASQRDISVSEFFAKNRHLLGFDNPRKALLTTVKEAVDNSLDACEEAGILPEIWVHIEPTGPNRYQGRRAGQRAGHRQRTDPDHLRQAALRLEVPPPADEPRPAGHRHQRRRHVRRAHHRQAGEDHLARSRQRKPAHYYEIQIDTKKNKPEILNGRGEGVDIPPGEPGDKAIEKHGIEWIEVDHGTRVTIELEAKLPARPRQRRRVSRTDGHRQSARHAPLHRSRRQRARLSPRRPRAAARAEGDQAAPLRRRAGQAGDDAQGHEGADDLAVPDAQLFARQLGRGQQDLRDGRSSARGPIRRKIGRHEADALYQAIQQTKIAAAGHRLHRRRSAKQLLLKGLHQVVPGEFYVGGHAAAGRLSRQSVSDRGGAGLRRRVDRAQGVARSADANCSAKATPARCGSS